MHIVQIRKPQYMVCNYTEVHCECFSRIINVLAHFHVITLVLFKLLIYELDMFWQPHTCIISY